MCYPTPPCPQLILHTSFPLSSSLCPAFTLCPPVLPLTIRPPGPVGVNNAYRHGRAQINCDKKTHQIITHRNIQLYTYFKHTKISIGLSAPHVFSHTHFLHCLTHTHALTFTVTFWFSLTLLLSFCLSRSHTQTHTHTEKERDNLYSLTHWLTY